MLDTTTKRQIDSARDILVGKVPDPKAQIDQITTAMIYKFMDDMDKEAEELGGKARFFADNLADYSWTKLMDTKLSGDERINLYKEGIEKLKIAPNIPELFRNIFKNYYLPFYDQRTLSLFLKEINEFSYDNSENLGNAFEYLLSILGSQGDAGQFRTPRHIIDFIVSVVDPQKNETILDPACGTAGFLISAYKHIIKTNSSNYKPEQEAQNLIVQGETAIETIITESVKYAGDKLTPDDRIKLTQNIAGYDIDSNMVKLALVNLYLHGFPNPKITEYDTLSSEKRWDENFDVILANPPFMTPKGGIVPHKRFSIQANRAEVLFVDYIAEHLSIKGRAGIIVPEGIIFQSANAYKNLRKNLIENWGLYAVVSLPSGVFQPYSGVKTSILLLDKEVAKKTDEILFLKVEHDGFDLGAQRRKIDKNDLPDCFNILNQWKKTPLAPLVRGEETTPNLPLSGEEQEISPLTRGNVRRTEGLEKEFSYIPYNQKLTELARENRKNPTKAEQKIWNEVLRNKNFSNYKFHRQKPLDNFIADFYCFKLRLIIEIDGDSHADKREYDEIRTEILNQYGLTVLRYTNDEVLNNIEGVYDDLMEKIKPTPALPCQGGSKKSPPDKGDLGGLKNLAFAVKKEKIAENGDYNLTGDRYRETVDYSNAKWEMVELGEVCEVISGQSPEGKYYNENGDGLAFYQGKTEFQDMYIGEPTKWTTQTTKIAIKNDILMSVRAPVGPINFATQEICIGRGLASIRGNKEKISQTYLFYILRNKEKDIKGNGGAAFDSINRSDIQKIQIPLPPLSIQEQIVAEIETEQKVVNANKELIEKMQKKVEAKIGEVWGE